MLILMEFKKKKLKGVKTTVVCPFFIDTGMFEGVKTKFSFLLPILKEKKVVNKIVKAIKKNKAVLRMPWLVSTVPLLRVIPTCMMDWIAKFLGISSSMDDFKGRD